MDNGMKDMTGSLKLVGASQKHHLVQEGEWHAPEGKTYRCQVYLTPEPEGSGYSVIAATLPGVADQGDTEAEALENIKDAFKGVLAVYEESGEAVPWLPEPRVPEQGGVVRWVIVNG